jgi:FkbM family methyltransferase
MRVFRTCDLAPPKASVYHIAMRTVTKPVKRLLESVFNVRIYSTRPHGRDDCHDIQGTGLAIRTILDVGAHIGESALKFITAFPDATIHSFEPVTSTFDLLRHSVSGYANIHCHQLALGRAAGSAPIYLTQHSSMSSLARPDVIVAEETVRVTTVHDFVTENALSHIDLLKIDAEGLDLEVLHGATTVLEEGRVSFVLAEVAFQRLQRGHVLFDDVRDFLVDRGFSVFGIYDQQLEWSGENRLSYANACFCHEKVLVARRQAAR